MTRRSTTRTDLLISAGLAALALFIYLPVRAHEFVNFDDAQYVSDNAMVLRGLTWEGVRWAFTAVHAGNWHPLTWLSHMLDVTWFGADAGAHHVTNVVLHIANAVLLFHALRRLTGARWPAAFVAALFAAHPLHVESVAWVAERKDVLSTSFMMLTLLAYASYTRYPTWWRYLGVFVLFALGLMAKPMLVTLPFVLLLLDVWPGRDAARSKTVWRLVGEKVPLLALSAASSVVTFIVQQQAGAVKGLDMLPLGHRVENAAVAYVAYIGKTMWPAGLAAIYPYRASFATWEWLGACLVLVGITAGAWHLRRSAPYLLVGWCWYLGTLVPVIGLVQVGNQAMADRYAYVPVIGLFLMAAWAGRDLVTTQPRVRSFVVAAAAMSIVGCAAVARVQAGYWHDSIALWRHATAVTAANYRAHGNLGHALAKERRFDEAIAEFRAAIAIKPDYAEGRNYLGQALADTGDPASAAVQYREAIRALPGFAEAHNNLGLALAAQGDFAGAIASFTEAARLSPSFAIARSNLGIALAQTGRVDEAIRAFTDALALDPGSEPTRHNLAAAYGDRGKLLAAAGRLDEGLASLLQAATLEPRDADLHRNIGVVLANKGQIAEAIREVQLALQLDPANEELKQMLAALMKR